MSDGCSDDHDHRHIDDGDVHDHQCDHNPNDQLDQHVDIDIDVDQHVYSNDQLDQHVYSNDQCDQHLDIDIDVDQGRLHVVALCQRRDMHRLYFALLAAMQCVAICMS